MTSLSLPNNAIIGEIPSDLFELPKLESIDLQMNSFTGFIPTVIGTTTALKSFNVESNALNGEIPIEIGNAASLTSLNVGNNMLQGMLPLSIFDLSLRELRVHGNRLTGKCWSVLFINPVLLMCNLTAFLYRNRNNPDGVINGIYFDGFISRLEFLCWRSSKRYFWAFEPPTIVFKWTRP